jgi:hypothetical protein
MYNHSALSLIGIDHAKTLINNLRLNQTLAVSLTQPLAVYGPSN